jgi:flagellar motor switch protein FliN
MKAAGTSDAGLDEGAPKPAATQAVEPSLVSLNDAVFKNVTVQLQAKLGRTELSVEDLLALRQGSILKLDSQLNDLVELRLNDAVVARGEIVAVDDSFGVRIVEIARTT